MESKTIVCTVTNDLNYDQRMQRICSTLSYAGYDVLLVGRRRQSSSALRQQVFRQKRLYCFFDKGKLFYIEYNIRLFIFLLFVKVDAICAIDLDTILPCLWASQISQKKRVYDAHELFCEMEEIVSRPNIYKIWKAIEKYAVPKFTWGYTIGECYAEQFNLLYGVQYAVVRNATVLQDQASQILPEKKYILYQGAVNEGRSFETLIPAMQNIDCTLIICGEGNFYTQAVELTQQYHLQDKIIFKGYVEPALLRQYTSGAYIGITLFTHQGKSNYYSMANRFFDYMHAGVPQLCVAFPEYVKVNTQFQIASLIENCDVQTISDALQNLLNNPEMHQQMKKQCALAKLHYCWQEEEKKLKGVYQSLFAHD